MALLTLTFLPDPNPNPDPDSDPYPGPSPNPNPSRLPYRSFKTPASTKAAAEAAPLVPANGMSLKRAGSAGGVNQRVSGRAGGGLAGSGVVPGARAP